ncbi:MAG: putative toxin-antitoxin system toxin component, PIN family [Anaerolineae bacterium]|nr:putative toxin-antitoxin system toxin component, PIN family [Anaerolineae bacterium]
MRVVLDTNVLVAFLLTRGPAISSILDGWERGDFELLTSPALVAEVRRTLEKPALRERIRMEAAAALLEALEKDASMTSGYLELSGVTPDPDDDAVISCAVEGDADYIVSRDMHLLQLGEYEGIQIVDPVEFVQRLRGT